MSDFANTDITDPDSLPPETLTVDIIAEDLSLANDEGTGWFQYQKEDDHLVVEQWGVEGDIVAKYRVELDITRIDSSTDNG